MAYGQTGSGKTYTMGTNNEIPEGVIPRAVRTIFNKIAVLKDQYDFTVRVAFVELYNEKLYDLLSQRSKIKEECIVDLREDPTKGYRFKTSFKKTCYLDNLKFEVLVLN